MPAIGPVVGTAASLFGGWFGNRQSKEEKAALAAQGEAMKNMTGAGKRLTGMGEDQYSLAGPAYGAAMNYYSGLLSGNRARQSQAVAPQYKAATDVYRGAERSLDAGNLRGGERDWQRAELNRDRASTLSGLVTGVQPAAAQTMLGAGERGFDRAGNLYSQAVNAYSGGGNLATSAYAQANQERNARNERWGNVGKTIYGIWGPIFRKRWGGGSGSTSAGASTGSFDGQF